MEIGPDPRGAVLSWRIRLADLSGRRAPAPADQLLRNRRPRDRRLCARSRFRRHACRDLVRARAQRDPRAQSPAALRRAPIAARPRSSRSSRAPASNSSATRIRAPASSAKARSPRRPAAKPGAWRKLDDQGKLWTFDPAASFSLEASIAADGEVEVEFIIGRADNAVWASRPDFAAARPAGAARSRIAEMAVRDARGRAVAGAAFALAVRVLRTTARRCI